jgi:UDP-N-acetylglucosamine 2-epimerase (non-hydrolysing)
VLVVIGTRPEAIKMGPVVAALRARGSEVETRVALTGQHDELVDQVLTAFRLDPDYDLGIMKQGQSVHDVLGASLGGLRRVVEELRPDALLVEGDTATVFAGALVGFLERVKVGHVEAGLRSHDKWAPFPEEIFRRLADVLSDYYFAPTARAKAELLAENVPRDRIRITGNPVVDALLAVSGQDRPIEDEALRSVVEDGSARLVLLTAHRRESFGEPLRSVFGAVRALADRVADAHVVYPVHPNPNVLVPARELLSHHPRIHLTAPLDYFDLVAALRRASLVLTDSGGIQEEAPTFGTPVLVLRDVTERPEGVEAGVAELVGTDPDRILRRALAALGGGGGASPTGASATAARAQAAARPTGAAPNPYGDGRAGERIADIIVSDLTGAPRTTEDWMP